MLKEKMNSVNHATGGFKLYLQVSLLKQTITSAEPSSYFLKLHSFLSLGCLLTCSCQEIAWLWASANSKTRLRDHCSQPPSRFVFPLPPDGSEIMPRLSCKKQQSQAVLLIPSDHPGNAISQPLPFCHCFPCLISCELGDLSWSLSKQSQLSALLGVQGLT